MVLVPLFTNNYDILKNSNILTPFYYRNFRVEYLDPAKLLGTKTLNKVQ